MKGNSCSIRLWFRKVGSEVVSKTDQLVVDAADQSIVGEDGGDVDGYRRSCTRRRWADGGRCW